MLHDAALLIALQSVQMCVAKQVCLGGLNMLPDSLLCREVSLLNGVMKRLVG